jgi:hypothetical protein
MCGPFEAAHAAHQRFLSRPLFERLAWIEEEWRMRGEDAIRAEMETRITAWLLSERRVH